MAAPPPSVPARRHRAASFEWSGDSPTAYLISLNVHRRHLTEGQLAAIAVEAKVRFEAEAREQVRQHGGTAPSASADRTSAPRRTSA